MKAYNVLALLMKNRNMTGRELAKLTGISNSTISQVLNGRVVPTDEELEKICVALGVAPEQIYPSDEMRKALAE